MDNHNQQLDVEEVEIANQLDLFSEEVEDRFNANLGSSFSTASTLTSCWGSLSSACTIA